jgi:hypothetical protein
LPGHGACAFPFDPDSTPYEAPALWHPSETGAIAIIDGSVALPPVHALPGLALHRRLDDGCHIVLRDGEATLRLWLRPPHAVAPAAALPAFHLPLDRLIRRRIEATARAQAWLDTGTADRGMAALSPYQRARLSLMLALLDADAAGASLRTLAGIAYPALPRLSASQWKISSERRGTHRLIGEARQLRDGGYRRLLTEA